MDWVYIGAVVITVLSLPVQASAKKKHRTVTFALVECSYVITVPATFRPGMLVNMTVLILKEDLPGTPVDVNVTFLINSVATTSATGQFRAGKTGSLQLQIPTKGLPDKSTRYRSENHLRVTGSGGLTFNETALTGISFKDKGFSVYVQTDKSIYKPSQTVHMRILAVYPDLKVYTGKMTILITDPKNNKLSKWKDESTTSGVVTKDFELSSQPNMGNWKISVEIEEHTEETTFEVKEYVLPKFKVDVLTNTYASAGNGDIQGSVSAKYTYGKGVKGKAKMSVYFPCHNRRVKISHTKDERQCKADVTEFQIDGTHSFGIADKKILSLYPYDGSPYHGNGWNKVVVNISVTDELTQKTHFGYTTVGLHGNSIVLKYSDSNPKYFKPNVAFQILIEVTRPDDSPITNGNIKVKVSTSTYPKSTALTRTYTTDKDGYIVVQQTITQHVQQFIIKAEAVDEYGMKAILDERLSKFNSKSNTFLSLTTDDYEVQAGKEIVCNVLSTEAFSSLNYMIQSRGNTIVSNSVLKSPKGKSASLNFSATSLMSPSAKIVVYFVRDNGEIVADSLTIKVNGAFENHVSVEFSAEVRKPGEAINVDVKASPYSLVGLLAVDKSVLLLKKSNDFSVEQVMEDLNSYDGGASFPSWWRWRRSKRSFFPWYPSAEDSYGVFKAVGVTVLTDCDDFNNEKRVFLFNGRMESDSKILFESSYVDGGQTQLSDVKKIRTFFPETWLWRNIETNSAGNAQVSTIVPDTITSWVLSSFAVSNVTGFGVAHDKPQLRVFQPFFLYMDLPYSVIRGEELAIKVIIFNYEDTEMQVTVTLKSSGDWNNLVAIDSNDVNSESSSNADVVRVITVPANGGETILFPIEPIKLGNIPITVTAQSTTSADAAKRNLLVEPEGIEQEYSYSLLIDLDSTSIDFSKELELALPANVVQGSAKATISVIGDIMGSSISGIEKLLKMPYGCGEQNMINFAPSMFIRTYLETVGQLTPSIKEKSVRFMTSGYQRELSYQHHDGSYSAFGERDGVKRSGSLWLTAFVVKSFSRAQSYIYIDPEYLWKSIKFILSTQLQSGSFKESGRVSSYLQGGLKSSAPEALTAYVLVSLLESGNNSPEVKEGISKAVRFLKEKLNTIEDTYTLAIMAYAMELADDPEKERVLNKLLEKAIREDGTMHWTEQNSQNEKNTWSRPYYKPRSADIEITSYALLVYDHKAEKRNGLPISRWLAQQRNSLGGYSSTQDTVIGLQALSEFAPLVFSPNVNLTVDVKLSSDSGFKKLFQIDKNNMIILQKEELPTVDGKVRISGSGKGICVVQIGVTYNVDKAPGDTSFKLNVKVISANKKAVKAQSCVAYTGDEPKSGMVIMEFGLPSGFSIDQDDVSELLSDENNKIKRVETSGRKAVLYFDEVLKTEELCVTLNPVRSYDVGKAQPIPVVVYDYYKPEKRATTMYSAEATENVAARLATSFLQSVVIAFLIMLFADFC